MKTEAWTRESRGRLFLALAAARRKLARGVIASGVGTVLLAGSAYGALNTSLVNVDFSSGAASYWNPAPNPGWSQYHYYNVGIWGTNAVQISGCSGGVGTIIAQTASANVGYMFQSLGTVDSSDVGKVYTLTGGAAAWDWYNGTSYGKGNVVASFRAAAATNSYGTLLGRASTILSTITSGSDGVQNGLGDDGNFLQPLSAVYAPTSADIGRMVYAVIDLNLWAVSGGGGERRFVFDNLAVSATNRYSGLATALVNPSFDSTNAVAFDPRNNGWLEHESYQGIGPGGSGAGIFSYFGSTISGATGGALTLIPSAAGANQVTVMQSIGFVNTNDVGKTLKFSVGARAWDWYANQTYSGVITASFRAGMSPDGETTDFSYGAMLGTAGGLTTGVTNSNGAQDGIGDGGNSLATITATYTVATNAIGKEVFAAINLDSLTQGSGAENRYVVDNAVLALNTNPAPSISITWPTNRARFVVPTDITLTAGASSGTASIASVEFFIGTLSLGVVTNPPYTLTTTNIKGGAITYTARATDSVGASTLSAAVTITNTAAALRITGLERGADGTITLTWASQLGTVYAVEMKTNLLSAWTDCVTGIPAGGPLTSYVIPPGNNPNPATQLPMYFRVRQQGVSISVVLVNTPSDGTGLSTFQSHNQKVVANTNGVFMTYLDTCADTSPNIWRLARSTDGGQSFTTVYQGSDYTKAPAMETDESNNIYLAYPTYGSSMHFLRFSANNGYTSPGISQTYAGVNCAAKYAMAYDQPRQRFYIATQYGRLLTVDKSGNLLNNQQVFSSNSGNSGAAYPNVCVDTAGVLHFGETVADGGNNIPYQSIRYVKSTDGGATWQAMRGTLLTTPTTPEPTGPSDMINLPDEVFPLSTWLSAMHVKQGKVHFTYRAVNPWVPSYFGLVTTLVERQHYMRFNGSTGVRELDSWSAWGAWQGTGITLAGVDGLLASNPNNPSGPVYAVQASTDGHLSALVSLDNGSTWVDYATTSQGLSGIYAVGGCRTLTPDGKVIGSFSAVSGGLWRTYFFSLPGYGAP